MMQVHLKALVALSLMVFAGAAQKAHAFTTVSAKVVTAEKTAKASSNKQATVDRDGETPSTSKKAKLSRDISFRGSQVDGKYLSAGESVAEVESEKTMGALIGIRKNFRDKLGAERARLKSEGK